MRAKVILATGLTAVGFSFGSLSGTAIAAPLPAPVWGWVDYDTYPYSKAWCEEKVNQYKRSDPGTYRCVEIWWKYHYKVQKYKCLRNCQYSLQHTGRGSE